MEQQFIRTRLHFNLRQTQKHNIPTIIYCVFSYGGKQYKINTGVKVKPSQWSQEKGLPIVSNLQGNVDNRNNRIAINILSQFKFAFDETLVYLCNASSSNLASEIKNNIKNRKIHNDRMTNNQIISWFNEHIETVDKKAKSKGSKKQYKIAVQWFGKYLSHLEQNGQSITELKEIARLRFFNQLRDWMFSNYRNKKGENVNLSTIQKSIGTIHTLLKWAIEEEIITKSEWIDCKPQTLTDVTAKDNQPFLMDDEIMAIYNYTPRNNTEEKVKDLFLLECTCGQRFGDIANLGKSIECIGNSMIINCITEKESARVHCEIIFEIAKEILEKYKFNLPIVSNDKCNSTIKSIARKCGLDRPCTVSIQKGNDAKPTVTKNPLWQEIHTHTGRHTFDSLLKLRGYSSQDIAKYSGHNTEMVERYTKACNGATELIYRELKEKHPELILKTVNDAEGGTIQASSKAIDNYIAEYKQVLAMLKVDASEWFDLTDIDQLHRLIVNEEHRLLEEYGIKVATVKALYNSTDYQSIKEKAQALEKLRKEITPKMRVSSPK